jgi:Zn-dependent M32 family carboxypeptidase
MDELENALPVAIKKLEEISGVKVSRQRIDETTKHVVYIVIHELAHAYMEKALPWLKDLEDGQPTLIDEVLSRFLERKVSKEHLYVESFEEQLKELKMYSPLSNLDWNAKFYSELYEDFEKHVARGESLESFAKSELTRRLRTQDTTAKWI